MKNYIITFCLTFAVCVVVTIVILMTNVPQIDTDELGSVQEYKKIDAKEFSFDNNKNISTTPFEKNYEVTREQLNKFVYTNSYKPGNSNPFTPNADLDNSTDNNTDEETNDKTDNGNNGQTNDSNTGK